MIRTPEEILDRMREVEGSDPLAFYRTFLITCLPFEHAQPYLKPGVTVQGWAPQGRDPYSDLKRLALSRVEMWEAAVNARRVLPCLRHMNEIMALKWLAGHEDEETMPGGVRGIDAGHLGVVLLNYVTLQIHSGQWDHLSQKAKEARDAGTN